MLPAGDLRDRDTLGTGLRIHVALVIVSHAVRCTCEVGFSLTAVPALTNRLAIPDVTLGALLRAHELVAGCALWHSNGALVALDVYIACCHTALVAAHIRTAFLKGLTVLKLDKKQRYTEYQSVAVKTVKWYSLMIPWSLFSCQCGWVLKNVWLTQHEFKL